MLSMNTTLSSTPSEDTDDRARGARTKALFEERTASDDPEERRRIHEEIVTLNLGVADSLAQRYSARGLPIDDLVQEARLALVRVVESFRPEYGHDFLSYAVPSILGALRKQFRDSGWTVRPPRRIQEAQQAINQARSDLLQNLGREPRVAELADTLDLDEETVIEALSADGCYTPASLDRPVGGDAEADSGARTLGSVLGGDDPDYASCEARVMLRPLLERLEKRDRTVLRLRFVDGLTQREVGEEIGVTQMQVSRILSRIFNTLREEVGEVPDMARAS
ncbi:MAG TPA: sigma-70 family RNA polymerase sigma factor [Marmoricola sp.]|jgi:RNA polymerase sigma-B factor|nr:sigma-70 family RNA polymerase sigma factor [Marmoricola sp.]